MKYKTEEVVALLGLISLTLCISFLVISIWSPTTIHIKIFLTSFVSFWFWFFTYKFLKDRAQ